MLKITLFHQNVLDEFSLHGINSFEKNLKNLSDSVRRARSYFRQKFHANEAIFKLIKIGQVECH
jgi:hypothetical protein